MTDQRKNRVTVLLAAAFFLFFSIWAMVKPPQSISESERRKLAAFPALTLSSVSSGRFMQQFAEYAEDQFPLRSQLRAVKAQTSLKVLGQLDVDGVYEENGVFAGLDLCYEETSAAHALKRFGDIYDQYLVDSGAKVYASVIPDKCIFLAENGRHPSYDFSELEEEIRAGMPYAQYVSLLPYLELDDYYRTDTHWRQEAITDAALALRTAMGAPGEPASYEEKTSPKPFYGVYTGQLPVSAEPDRLTWLTNEEIEECTVYDAESGITRSVYDTERLSGADPYELYLSGPRALLTITNPAADKDRRLILFRDSFGSSIAPLLISGYREIVLVDIRYLAPEQLGRYLSFEQADVLFLYSSLVLNHSSAIR